MDILRAKEIIEGLANGVNPLTGEVLPPEDSCNQPDVVRALHAILSALPKKMQKAQPENGVSHGQVKMTAFLRPCMMKEKHAKKYANISNVQQAASLQDWFGSGKYPTEKPFGKRTNGRPVRALRAKNGAGVNLLRRYANVKERRLFRMNLKTHNQII